MNDTTSRKNRNVSLPVTLHEALSAHPEENWSAVAAKAFEQRLGEIKQQQNRKEKKPDLMNTINRLRKSKAAHDGEQYTSGKTAGREWAQDVAEAPQLERLEEYNNDLGRSFRQPLHGENIARELASVIENDQGLSWNDVTNFWERSAGVETLPNGEYLGGFVDGAIGLWQEVKDEL